MVQTKTGGEHFYFDGMPTDFLLNDFWQWQASDLLNNALRGVLAEFIVAKALGIDTSKPRVEWDPYDLLFNNRERIEVKSSAYVQSWEQKKNTDLNFKVNLTHTPENDYSDESARQSDMYIFCVLAEKDREKADPLILDQWRFYPVLTSVLNEALQSQKTAGISTIARLCPEPYDYNELRDAVLCLFYDDAEARKRIESNRALKRLEVAG